MTLEYCKECDTATGNAGVDEDSLYVDDDGPYCDECYVETLEHKHEKLKEKNVHLKWVIRDAYDNDNHYPMTTLGREIFSWEVGRHGGEGK